MAYIDLIVNRPYVAISFLLTVDIAMTFLVMEMRSIAINFPVTKMGFIKWNKTPASLEFVHKQEVT